MKKVTRWMLLQDEREEIRNVGITRVLRQDKILRKSDWTNSDDEVAQLKKQCLCGF